MKNFGFLILGVFLLLVLAGILIGPDKDDNRADGEPREPMTADAKHEPGREASAEEGRAPTRPDTESEARAALRHVDDILDLAASENLDLVRADLEQRFEDGDSSAAWALYQISLYCGGSLQWISQWRAALDNTTDPDRRMELQEEIDRFEAVQGLCYNSELADRRTVQEEMGRWQWEAAEAGVEEAMMEVAFARQGLNSGYEALTGDRDVSGMAQRQKLYADELRNRCHTGALRKMGEGFAENDPFLRGWEYKDHPDRDHETARQIEAFAHLYTAAAQAGESEPARQSRNPSHPLTAFEELAAIELANTLLSNCNPK